MKDFFSPGALQRNRDKIVYGIAELIFLLSYLKMVAELQVFLWFKTDMVMTIIIAVTKKETFHLLLLVSQGLTDYCPCQA